jgi:PAS domain S-box-containing protein
MQSGLGAAAQESEPQLAAFERLKTPIWLTVPQRGTLSWANFPARTLLGIDASGMGGGWSLGSAFTAVPELAQGDLEQLVSAGSTRVLQWRTRNGGRVLDTATSLFRNERNFPVLMHEVLGQSIEFASLARAAEAIRLTDALIFIFDGQGHELFRNPAARRRFPPPPPDTAERLGALFVDTTQAARARAVLVNARPYRARAQLQTKRGPAWHSVAVRPIIDPVDGSAAYLMDALDCGGQVKAEQAIRASEARFRSLIALSSDWYWEQDELLRFRFFHGITEHSGIPSSEFFGKTRWEVPAYHVDDSQRAAHDLVLRERRPFRNFVLGRRASDGSLRYASISGEPIYDAAGHFTGYRGVGSDVTSRIRLEERLRDGEQLFRATFEQAAVGIAHVAPDGRWLRVNQRLCDMLGYSRAELAAKTYRDITHPDDLAINNADFTAVLSGRGDNSYAREKRYIRKDGSALWTNLTVSIVHDAATGAPAYSISIIEDISERKTIEQALAAENRVLSMTAGGTALPEVLTALCEIIEAQAPGAICSIWLIGESGWHLGAGAAPSLDPSLVAALDGLEIGPNAGSCGTAAFTGSSVVTTDLSSDPLWQDYRELVLPYGLFACWSSPIFGSSGQVLGTFAVYYRERREPKPIERQMAAIGCQLASIAIERHRAEQALLALKARLEERVRERTRLLEASNHELEAFCFSVSHDLRTPVRLIDGLAKAILQDNEHQLDESGRHFLHRLLHSSEHMAQVIEDLLRLSRLSRVHMQRRSVNLSRIATGIAADLQQNDPARLVEVTIAPALTAEADPGLMRIALSNLIGNAWKYTSRRTVGHIEFGAVPHEGKLAYFVRDDGAGFDMQHASRLFGAFQRLHRSADFPGHGVGLATVQRIVHRHGGLIWATAELDRGATFYFTLGD